MPSPVICMTNTSVQGTRGIIIVPLSYALLSSSYLWMMLLTPFLVHTQQPVLRLYAVPANAFTAEEEDEEAPFDGEDGEA